ncbi:MAG: tetratricopeptide repeat protein, partial [Anaerolineales bacterium]
MARISLRAYNRDIEAMIDGGQIDEAFSHCRYILERFPKHIDTYRLMGKALLEAQRFGDAADVFHRVLSSIPDDFIAHLGMSIIREDESNLDAAIWHMERSLEVQPSNAAVQVELRRLYGLRDGHTPQKIQLTRGALARMSAKSNLYTQAIAELRTALSDDPQRPDLLVVLAEMYKQTGARMEAVETCNSLISKLPYCLVANRILAEILPETEHAEKAQEYKNRLAELDPYYAQLSPVAPTLEQVPDGAVTIERYGYPGQEYQTTQTAQPEWAATLGVNIDEDVDYEEETPDWLKDEAELVVSAAAQEKMVEESPEDQFVGSADESQSGEATAEEDLPDWIKSAGLFEDEQSETPPVDVEPHAESDGLEDTEESELPLENADQDDIVSKQDEETQQAEPLPAWMSEVDFSEEEQISTETPISITEDEPETADSDFGEGLAQDSEIETPDWLHEAMAESDEDEEKAGILAVGAAAAIPAIFSDDDQEQELVEKASGDLPEEDTELAAESEQLHSEQPDSESIEAIEDIALDDKEDMIEHEGMAGAGAAALAGAAFARENESEDEVSIDALVSGSDFEESDFLEEGPSAESKQRDADIPDWLQDLGEDISEASTPDEIAEYEEPNLENEILPPISAQISDEEQPETLEEIPLSVEDSTVELAGEISEDEDLLASEFSDAIPDWLSEVSPESAPDLTEQEQGLLDEMPEIVRAEIPVWLRKMEQEHRAELAAAGELETAQELEFDSDITEITGEDVPTWLMSAMETELPGEPDAVSEVMDISEIISEVSPEEESVVEEGVSDELEMDQELVGEIEPSGALTAA